MQINDYYFIAPYCNFQLNQSSDRNVLKDGNNPSAGKLALGQYITIKKLYFTILLNMQ